MLARRDEVIGGLDDAAQIPWLESAASTLIRGHGRLDGERRVRVGGSVYRGAPAVVIAVGSVAAIPADSRARRRPAVDQPRGHDQPSPFRHAWSCWAAGVGRRRDGRRRTRRSASTVTVIEARGAPAPARGAVRRRAAARRRSRERGVDVRLGVRAKCVAATEAASPSSSATVSRVEGEEILVAVGRRPLTDDLGLETVGLAAGRARSPSMTHCGCPACRGCTRSATSTGARC